MEKSNKSIFESDFQKTIFFFEILISHLLLSLLRKLLDTVIVPSKFYDNFEQIIEFRNTYLSKLILIENFQAGFFLKFYHLAV